MEKKIKSIILILLFATAFTLVANMTDNIVEAKTITINEFKQLKNTKNVYQEYYDYPVDSPGTKAYISTGKTKKYKSGVVQGQFKKYYVYGVLNEATGNTFYVKKYLKIEWKTIKSKVPVYSKKKVYYKIQKPYSYLVWKGNNYALTSNSYFVSQKTIKGIPYQGKIVHGKYYKIKTLKKYVTKTKVYKKNLFDGNSKYLKYD